MSETNLPLTLDELRKAVEGNAAGLRRVVELQPAGGVGDKVFPPTYEGGVYAVESRVVDGHAAPCVLLDSVQSQANRMELALLSAWRRPKGDGSPPFPLPVIEVDFTATEAARAGRITSLEAPHRIADAIIRDSQSNGTPFRQSDEGKWLDEVSIHNATALFRLCPTALLFGMWDSTGPRGGLGVKFERALVSEIVGIGVEAGVRTSSRIDPLGIQRNAGPIYERPDGGWTIDATQAAKTAKGEPIEKRSKRTGVESGAPAVVVHGNITPTIAEGGVTLLRAVQTTVLSFAVLRRLHFPASDKDDKGDPARDAAAQTALAALGLCAATLAAEEGYDLRSRCFLLPTSPLRWELLARTAAAEPRSFVLEAKAAIDLYRGAVDAVKAKGIPWLNEPLRLIPNDDLVKLVKRSFELAAQAGGE